jgi:hypothetical protein
VKYMILIHSNPQSREIWESFSDAQKGEGYAEYAALGDDLTASGELIVAEALADASLTKTVTVTDGKTIPSDGPFAEAKELLAGFFLIDCDGMDRAVEIAARVPETELGLVEVRPIMDLSGHDV